MGWWSRLRAKKEIADAVKSKEPASAYVDNAKETYRAGMDILGAAGLDLVPPTEDDMPTFVQISDGRCVGPLWQSHAMLLIQSVTEEATMAEAEFYAPKTEMDMN